MKYTVMGLNQNKLAKLGCDFIDAGILRYFIDFIKSGRMVHKVVEGNIYYWIKYDAVLEDLPLLHMKKASVQSRFYKLRDLGLLTHFPVREKGVYSYYGLSEKCKELIFEGGVEKDRDTSHDDINSYEEEDMDISHVDINPRKEDNTDIFYVNINPHKDENNPHYEEKNTHPCGLKCITNNPSTKYPSKKNKKENIPFQETVFEIIEYLNGKTGSSFRSTTKVTIRLIKARVNEGFTVEDFKTVIDNMKAKWTGTKFQQYLVPTTLFGSKFEAYLNQRKEMDVDEGLKRGNLASYHEVSREELEKKIKAMTLEGDM